VLLVATISASKLLADIRAEASFQPPQIAQGDQSRYVIRIIESDASTAPQAAPVDRLPQLQISSGLQLRNGRREVSRQTQITNGQANYTSTVQLSLDATTSQMGEFSVASFEMDYKGHRIQVPAASLLVVERPQNASPPRSELIQLKAQLPEQLYLGQRHVAQLQLLMHESVDLQDYQAIQRNADAFTIPAIEDPVVRETMIQGHRYKILEWPLLMTPIQSGEHRLHFHTVVQVALPENPHQRGASPFPRSPFGGSFFNRIFRETETIELETPIHKMLVRTLPQSGQPQGYSGAIGQFNCELSIDQNECQAQDPITLSLRISGTGNFPRVQAPELTQSDAWRSYPPDESMELSTTRPLSGSKRFDYILRPQIAGQLTTPQSTFSYFDPESETYVELEIPGQPVEVRPASQASNVQANQGTQSLTTATKTTDLSDASKPFTLEPSPEANALIFNDLFKKRGILYCINTALALVCLVGFLRMRHRKQLHTSSGYRLRHEAKKSLKVAMNQANSAHKNKDLLGFAAALQDAIRYAICSKTGLPLNNAELPEIEKALAHLSVTEGKRNQLKHMFELANQMRYAPQSLSQQSVSMGADYQELKKWIRSL
jgi:hypothetical protein